MKFQMLWIGIDKFDMILACMVWLVTKVTWNWYEQ